MTGIRALWTKTLRLYRLLHLYMMKVRPSPLDYDTDTLQTTLYLHDDRNQSRWTRTLRLYRLLPLYTMKIKPSPLDYDTETLQTTL